MQVTGVQPVGARGLATVQPQVADPRGANDTVAGGQAAGAARATRAPTLIAEPVTFPRDGVPLDRWPLELRRSKAAMRYRESQELGQELKRGQSSRRRGG